MKILQVCITLIMMVSFSTSVYAVEKAERISDREIIESLAELKSGQKALEKRFDDLNNSVNRRFDDLNNSVNRRFDDMMTYLQILTGAILVVGGGVLGWLVIIWRKLVTVEERQKRFETQDDEIKFLKEAYNRLNEMVLKMMDALKPPKGVL